MLFGNDPCLHRNRLIVHPFEKLQTLLTFGLQGNIRLGPDFRNPSTSQFDYNLENSGLFHPQRTLHFLVISFWPEKAGSAFELGSLFKKITFR